MSNEELTKIKLNLFLLNIARSKEIVPGSQTSCSEIWPAAG